MSRQQNTLRQISLQVMLFLSLFSWSATGLAAETVEISTLQIQQGTLISAKIPQFSSGLAPELLSLHNEKFRQLVFGDLAEFELIAFKTRLAPHLPESIKTGLTLMSEYEVFRNDQQVISLVQRVYQYTGGAHGMTLQTAYTIDLVTGRNQFLADLFVSGSDYAERLSRIVRKVGVDRKLPLWDFKGIGAHSTFFLSDEGLVLFFQPYEIAPYSEGIVKILVPYGNLADILQPGLKK